MKRTKEFIKRNIAGEIVLVPSGQTAREFNGMVPLTETAEFIGNDSNIPRPACRPCGQI